MSKAILIIDTPKSCNDCPLRVMESDLYYTYFTCQDDSCITEDSQEITRLEMNCPLKPLPQKIEILDSRMKTAIGWNMCLDEILGEKE